MNTPTVLRTLAAAAVLAAVCLATEAALTALAGTTAPLISLLGVVAGAWYGGLPCGMLVTLLATTFTPLTVPPLGTFKVIELADVVRVGLLGVLGVGATFMVA